MLHRGAFSQRSTGCAETFVRTALSTQDPRFALLINAFVHNVVPTAGTKNFFADPIRMLGNAILVLKSPSSGQKGVVTIWYNHVFPLFARFFELNRIADRYHIVLEPSWSGCCDLNLLPYTLLRDPVFIQAIEPHDIRFLIKISSNLVPVQVSFNSWVDHRRMRPLPDVEKEFDLVMVAGWGQYKRHHQFFRALSQLRLQGRRLEVLLLGGSAGWSKETIIEHAKYYGVHDQVVLKENVLYDQVNAQLNRAKVHVLWSRREGVNRAIIEAMFAGLPCVIHKGFNYGYAYPYVNPQTGRFATQRTLPRVLMDVVARYQDFAPRKWVMEHMTCQLATLSLEQAIADKLGENVEDWMGQLAVKTNELHSMRYFNDSLLEQFQSDYEFLRTVLR
jgi:glycosyltransferase involved in cell wall biosynthesis